MWTERWRCLCHECWRHRSRFYSREPSYMALLFFMLFSGLARDVWAHTVIVRHEVQSRGGRASTVVATGVTACESRFAHDTFARP